MTEPVRLAKRVAAMTQCSRREADGFGHQGGLKSRPKGPGVIKST